MRVRMLTVYAGVRGTAQPGQVIDAPEEEARQLVAGRYAEWVDPVDEPAGDDEAQGDGDHGDDDGVDEEDEGQGDEVQAGGQSDDADSDEDSVDEPDQDEEPTPATVERKARAPRNRQTRRSPRDR